MSNLVRFEKVDNELNILRIGGKSFLPPDVEWPTNPNGEKMVFIFNIPTNFLNSTLQFNYPKDQVISVFTTYNREDYFLDSPFSPVYPESCFERLSLSVVSDLICDFRSAMSTELAASCSL